MSATEKRTSTTLVAAVALFATFLVGILVGVAADRMIILRYMHRRPPGAAEFLMKRLDRRLDLTPQQERQVTIILQNGELRIGNVWGKVGPQIRQEIERTNSEIERVLTPEQRVKFAEIKMKMSPRRSGRGMRFRHD